jgi:DNA replication protein DnaC
MMTNDTSRKLIEMKLHGMARGFQEQLIRPASGNLSFEDRFGMLVDMEVTDREDRRLKRLLSSAKLRESACIEDIDYRTGRGIDPGVISTLATCNWIRHGINIILTGMTGSGKTWLACALGNQACRFGLSVAFKRLPTLLEDLGVAHGTGNFVTQLDALAKADLLILDDFGMGAMDAARRGDLLEVIEKRSGRRSTLITSQLPVNTWHEYLSGGNPTVADAIMDRLVSGAHRMNIGAEIGRSMRDLLGGQKTIYD